MGKKEFMYHVIYSTYQRACVSAIDVDIAHAQVERRHLAQLLLTVFEPTLQVRDGQTLEGRDLPRVHCHHTCTQLVQH